MAQYDTKELEAIPIQDVARHLGLEVRKKMLSCFIHQEKTPSLSLNDKTNKWKCYGCGEGGGVINLVQQRYSLGFKDACQWLCDEFRIPTSNNRQIKKAVTRTPIAISKDIVKNTPDPEVYKWIIDNLTISDNGKKYLTEKRHFPESIIKEYNIRSVDIRKNFKKECLNKFGVQRLINCGVFTEQKNRKTGVMFSSLLWYEEGLLFPYYNKIGEIIFIQFRRIDNIKENKYKGLYGINVPLYNINRLPQITNGSGLYICEGVLDCISFGLMGKNAVGVVGSFGFKDEHLDIIKDYVIYVIPDNDKAGEGFVNHIRNKLITIGKELGEGGLPNDCKDITDYYVNIWKKKS